MSCKKPETAMVFGAGLGKRMRPLTDDKPKPMVEVLGKPIIGYTLDKLRDFGIKKVVVNTHYFARILEDYLNKYEGLEIKMIHEPTLLDTGGGLVQALPHLGNNPFFVINGDIIWENSSTSLLQKLVDLWHGDCKAILTLNKVSTANGYDGNGDFLLSKENVVTVSVEAKKPYVFTGIQIIDPNLLHDWPMKPFSLIEVYKKNIPESGELKGIYGLVHDGEWYHIGTPEAVIETEKLISELNSCPTGSSGLVQV